MKVKVFENDWKGSYTGTPYYYMRLKDSAKWLQGEGSMFTPENPCDSIQFTMPFLWLLELKSTKSASVSHYPNTPYRKPDTKTNVMIKPNQVKALMESVNYEGVIAGFIINFRPRKLKTKTTENLCYFIHINDFIKFAKKHGKSTLSERDCAEIGIDISNYIKKVRYKYDITDFVNKAVEYSLNKGYISLGHIYNTIEWLDNLTKENDNV